MTGAELNPIPNSNGLAFWQIALCPQGPEGPAFFSWNRVQAVAKFWEKKKSEIRRNTFHRAMAITQTQS